MTSCHILFKGPSVDHTLGTSKGHYAYIDTFEGVNGHKARLVSEFYEPKESPSGQFCLSFFYFMYGNAKIGPLNVYVQTLNSNNINFLKRTTADGNLLWSENGNKGSMWLNASVEINEISEFFVVFESIVAGFKSDIAIDDITISPHACPQTSSSSNRPSRINSTTTTSTTVSTSSSHHLKSSTRQAKKCTPDYCKNGGTCRTVGQNKEYSPDMAEDVMSLFCECTAKFTGSNCETEIQDLTETGGIAHRNECFTIFVLLVLLSLKLIVLHSTF